MQIIPKLQQGGFASLFTTYIPTIGETPTATSSKEDTTKTTTTSKTADDDNFSQKELIQLLNKVDGLPNDMQAIGNSIINSLQLQALGGTASDIASAYLSNLIQVKQASFNKKEYDKAYKIVANNGGLNEYAITPSGGLIALDKDTEQMIQISPQEYLNNTGKYEAMTNSNLLYLRSNSSSYAMKNQILETVSNGIGLGEVNKMIKERLIHLGTNSMTQSGYSVKEKSQIVQGLQVLDKVASEQVAGKTGMTLDGLYKNKIITKDQKEQAQAALLYIYTTLPTNAQTLLQVKSGNTKNPKQGAANLISYLITSGINNTYEQDTTWEGTLEQVLAKPGTKGSKSGSDSNDNDDLSTKAKSGPYTDMVRMIGGNSMDISINKGTNYQMSANGVNYPSIPDTTGKPVGRTSLDNLLNSGLQGIITDRYAITFGNVSLSDTDFDNIMYSGSGGTMAILPTKMADNGRKVVDLEALDRWEAANKELRSMGINSVYDDTHQKQIAQVLIKHNLEKLVNMSSGTIDLSELGQFLIVDGYAVDNTSRNHFGNSDYISRINDDPDIISMIEQALSTDDNKYSIDPDNWYDFNGHDNIYRGSIYIPITSNIHQAQTAEGQKLYQDDATVEEYKYQRLQKMIGAKSASKDLIGR